MACKKKIQFTCWKKLIVQEIVFKKIKIKISELDIIIIKINNYIFCKQKSLKFEKKYNSKIVLLKKY